MKKFLSVLVVILFLSGCDDSTKKSSVNKNYFTDDLGRKVYIFSSPEKVITLAPNLTEILFDLGLGNKIVGNTTYCNYPEEAKKISKVGDLLSVDYEKILSLKPDLIFITTEGNTKIVYDKLLSLGQKVFVCNPKSFEGIRNDYLKISEIFNKKKFAEARIHRWKTVEDSIKHLSLNSARKKTMFLISSYPVILAGDKTFINEFLIALNLENIANNSKVSYPVFSREEIVLRNPEIILHTNHADNSKNFSEKYSEWKKIKAIQNSEIYYLNPDIYFRPGPRYILGLKDLYQKIRYRARHQ